MTDETVPTDLAVLAAELTPEDHERLTPPDDIWAGIETAMADEPVSLISRRNRRVGRTSSLLLAAAAVLAVVGVIGGVLASNDDSGGTRVAAASIVNDGLQIPNPDSGLARLIEVDGRFELELDVPDLPSADGFYEVWIIDTDVEGMFSLGVVDGDGRFTLPDDVDPFDFPVVDVSLEPADGNPLHSGQSIWRGVLERSV